MGKVANPDRAPADLVLIGGTDAASRRADLARPRRIFAQPIEIAMDRQDQRARLGDPQGFGSNLDALLANALDLGLQRPWVEHHAVADDRRRAAHDSAWQQRQLVVLVADDERV